MSRINTTFLKGRISKAEFFKHEGKESGHFRVEIAVEDDYQSTVNGQKKKLTDFFPVEMYLKNFEKQAGYFMEQLAIGNLVSCEAEIRSGSPYQNKEGVTVYPTYFVTQDIGALESKKKRTARAKRKAQ